MTFKKYIQKLFTFLLIHQLFLVLSNTITSLHGSFTKTCIKPQNKNRRPKQNSCTWSINNRLCPILPASSQCESILQEIIQFPAIGIAWIRERLVHFPKAFGQQSTTMTEKNPEVQIHANNDSIYRLRADMQPWLAQRRGLFTHTCLFQFSRPVSVCTYVTRKLPEWSCRDS